MPDVFTAPVDEPPADGVWRDWDGAQLDPAMVEEGNRLGLAIDVDDDEDNGL
jgi:hypothetical protein